MLALSINYNKPDRPRFSSRGLTSSKIVLLSAGLPKIYIFFGKPDCRSTHSRISLKTDFHYICIMTMIYDGETLQNNEIHEEIPMPVTVRMSR